jgi:4-hydroxy-3-methylbut-2-enyl diphosphate reductase
MRVKVSESIGFCYGVKNAVDLSKRALSKKGAKIFSVGPVIHNPQVVEDLAGRGLRVVSDPASVKNGTIIISSHGAGAKLKDKKGIRIIDATCPFVRKIQERVKRLVEEGYQAIIVGKREHPEVKGLVDVSGGSAIVIKDRKEAQRIRIASKKIGVVTQSTYSEKAFRDVVNTLFDKPFLEIRIFNTICKDTIRRQEAARRLAAKTDAMVVVGGRNSSNTKRLVEVARESGRPAYHIEDHNDLDFSRIKGCGSIGVACGASTPEELVRKIIGGIRRKCKR